MASTGFENGDHVRPHDRRGADVFGETDQAVEKANAYFNSIRPTKS